MTQQNKPPLPTTTVTQSRVQLFQPTQRPTYRRGDWVETAWGRCRVTGRLGQRHADIWEAICFCAESKREFNGRLELLVDPAAIKKVLSDKNYSSSGLNALLQDLTAAVVEIDSGGWIGSGHLIDDQFKSAITKPDPLTKQDRPMVLVRVGSAGRAFLTHDIGKWRDPALIARLPHGVSQAVARLVLSHKGNGRIAIDNALEAVGVKTADLRNARRHIKSDVGSLQLAGIVVEGGFVYASPKVSTDQLAELGLKRLDENIPQLPDVQPQPGACHGLLEGEFSVSQALGGTGGVSQALGSVSQALGSVSQALGETRSVSQALGETGGVSQALGETTKNQKRVTGARERVTGARSVSQALGSVSQALGALGCLEVLDVQGLPLPVQTLPVQALPDTEIINTNLPVQDNPVPALPLTVCNGVDNNTRMRVREEVITLPSPDGEPSPSLDGSGPVSYSSQESLFGEDPNPETRGGNPSKPKKTSTKTGIHDQAAIDILLSHNVPQAVINDYLAIRSQRKAALSVTATKRLLTEIEKSGWTPEDAVAECCCRGWTGFNASWVESRVDGAGTEKQTRFVHPAIAKQQSLNEANKAAAAALKKELFGDQCNEAI